MLLLLFHHQEESVDDHDALRATKLSTQPFSPIHFQVVAIPAELFQNSQVYLHTPTAQFLLVDLLPQAAEAHRNLPITDRIRSRKPPSARVKVLDVVPN